MKHEQVFWLAFSTIKGIGAVRFRKLLNFFGDLALAWGANKQDLISAGLTNNVADAVLEARKSLDLDSFIESLQKKDISFLTWNSPDYPQLLNEIAQPPPVLYYRGSITPMDDTAIAIVGTRNVTKYGKQITIDTATYLAGSGVTIVSGLARGVDGIAHRAALDAGGRTIAVLGSGVDVIYPPEHRKLASEIIENGAIVSDYPPGTKPDGINFPPRNRIISGLSSGTVVIEAGERSGALITAKFALDQGRDIYAVPGSVLSQMSKGTNQLIADGAQPMTNPAQITEALNIQRQVKRTTKESISLTKSEELILKVLGSESLHIDEICNRTSMGIEKLTADLTIMELKGFIERENGMEYRRVQHWDFN